MWSCGDEEQCTLILRDFLRENRFYADMPRDPEAKPLIEACWDLSLGMRSLTTATMRWGSLRTARCLEYVILDQLEFLFPPGSAAAKRLSRTEARAKLDQLREAYGSLYWGLYNEHAGCEPPGCGTLFYPLHNAAYAEMLEGIVRDVIRQRRAYGL